MDRKLVTRHETAAAVMDAAASAAHTPGPWSRNIRAGGKYPMVFAGRNQHVAAVQQQQDPAETEANIDLVAAAPDLLALAEAVAETIGHNGEVSRLSDYGLADLGDLARAAIAKARGQ